MCRADWTKKINLFIVSHPFLGWTTTAGHVRRDEFAQNKILSRFSGDCARRRNDFRRLRKFSVLLESSASCGVSSYTEPHEHRAINGFAVFWYCCRFRNGTKQWVDGLIRRWSEATSHLNRFFCQRAQILLVGRARRGLVARYKRVAVIVPRKRG